MATTLKNTQAGAKRNILSNSAIRYVGFVTAFIGVMLLMIGRMTSTVIQLLSILLMLIGLLLFSGNIKKIFKKQNDKDTTIYLLVGILMIAISVFLHLYGSQISKWIDLIIGIIIAVYGLIILINFSIKKSGKKAKFVFNVIVSSLFIVTGILIALLFTVSGHTFMIVTGVFATVTGLVSLIAY